MLDGELLVAYAWWEGKDGWNQILETNTWPVNTAIITTWKVKNTGDESAVFKTRLLAGESAEAWLTPGASFSFEQPDISLSPGTHQLTLQILAAGQVVRQYPIQVIAGEVIPKEGVGCLPQVILLLVIFVGLAVYGLGWLL